MKEDIKILEEHIKELEEEKVLYGGFLSRKQAIENLLKAYREDEAVIEEMAHYIWKYDCCEYEIGKNGKCEGYYLDTDCKEKCIIEYFRNKAKGEKE